MCLTQIQNAKWLAASQVPSASSRSRPPPHFRLFWACQGGSISETRRWILLKLDIYTLWGPPDLPARRHWAT